MSGGGALPSPTVQRARCGRGPAPRALHGSGGVRSRCHVDPGQRRFQSTTRKPGRRARFGRRLVLELGANTRQPRCGRRCPRGAVGVSCRLVLRSRRPLRCSRTPSLLSNKALRCQHLSGLGWAKARRELDERAWEEAVTSSGSEACSGYRAFFSSRSTAGKSRSTRTSSRPSGKRPPTPL